MILSNPFLISFLNSFINLTHLELFTESWQSKEYYFDLKRARYGEQSDQIDQFEHLEMENDAFLINYVGFNMRQLREMNEIRTNRENQDNRLNLSRDNNRDLRVFKREEMNGIYLNLPKLKILYFITDFSFKKISIFLSCPQLAKLITDLNVDCFKFKYPNSIEEIICEENNFLSYQFKNLKKLTCYYFNHNFTPMLYNLKNLKEFHFHKIDEIFINLNIDGVKIYYKNVEFQSNQTIQMNLRKLSAFALNDCSLDFYTKNSKLLCPNNGLIQRELRTNSFKHTSMDVINKLINLKVFYINYDDSDKNKYQEIFKITNLDRLIIRSPFASIDQRFLDSIPVFNSMITFLKVDDFENLKFLLQLRWLKTFKTEQFFDFELVKRMFDNLHDLRSIEILITVDIYKFKLNDQDQIICSYNHESFLEESKQQFINSDYQNCIYKLFQLFITNYK